MSPYFVVFINKYGISRNELIGTNKVVGDVDVDAVGSFYLQVIQLLLVLWMVESDFKGLIVPLVVHKIPAKSRLGI